jgi:para-aminobenzoate synthetase
VLRLLIVDNYDSFTYNLAHAAVSITGEMPVVVRNDEWTWEQIDSRHFDAIIVSPGPGHPANSRDFGVSSDVIRHATVPVLGVCLGHQGIALAFGGSLSRVEPAHGEVSRIEHDGDDLFRGIPAQFEAVRYHSLAVTEPLPPELTKIAWSSEGTIMALRHKTRPLWGVQFHPESILTKQGPTLLNNFIRFSGARTHACRVDNHVDANATFRKLYCDAPHSYWLDRTPHPLMGASREIISYEAATKKLTIITEGREEHRTQTLFDYLDESLRQNKPDPTLPFGGGYVGYFGYELRADCVSPVTRRYPYPDALLMRIGNSGRAPLVPNRDWKEQQTPDSHAKPSGLSRFQALMTDAVSWPQPRLTHAEYLEAIERCQYHLREGEAYELCLTTQIDLQSEIPALTYYEGLHQLNPAPYAAYLRFNDLEIACSSPECFLRIDTSGRIESRPIKGTVPRGRTPQEDAGLRHDLATNPRYRAENLMITDLVRNDLGRVAQPGSVQVHALRILRNCPPVGQHRHRATPPGRHRRRLPARGFPWRLHDRRPETSRHGNSR